MHDTVINCFFSINCHYAYNKAFLFLCLYFRLGWKKKTKKKKGVGLVPHIDNCKRDLAKQFVSAVI